MNYKTLKNIYPYDTAIGRIYVADNGRAIAGVFLPGNGRSAGIPQNETDVIKRAAVQITEYLSGRRREFDVKVEPEGTDFQKRVWAALRTIPYGHTCSYSHIGAYCGQSESMPCRWNGQQQKSGFDNNTVPQGDRQVRSTGGLRRRAGTEEILSGHGSCKYYSGLKFL